MAAESAKTGGKAAPAGDAQTGLRIFINYRRDDTKWPAGRLNDHLTKQFGKDTIFMDIDTLKPGENFTEKIQHALDDADVVLVLIGSYWLSLTDEDGRRRLDDPSDFVTREIAAALARDDVIVIPTLVDGARMPKARELPKSLGGLPDREASNLSTDRFGYDVGRMIERLRELEEEKKTREAERRRAEDVKREEEKKRAAADRAKERRAKQGQAKPGPKRATRSELRTPRRPRQRQQLRDDRVAPELLLTLRGNKEGVWGAAYSPDSSRIVACSGIAAQIWDAESGDKLHFLSRDDLFPVGEPAYSPDGTRIVTASLDPRIWDAASGDELHVLSGHENFVSSAAYSPDGSRIVTACWDGTARIWDAASGAQLQVLPHKDVGEAPTLGRFESAPSSAAYSPDGRRIVTASRDTARIWDAASGTELQVLSGHEGRVKHAAYSPDGSRILTTLDWTARIWDAASGDELQVLSWHENFVSSAAYSPDGSRIVTASQDGTARIWDAASGDELQVLSGHKRWVRSAAYSPDGSRIVTASDDGTARIWSIPRS